MSNRIKNKKRLPLGGTSNENVQENDTYKNNIKNDSPRIKNYKKDTIYKTHTK